MPRNCHSACHVRQTRAQPLAGRPHAAPGGYELAGPRGARRPPARTQPRSRAPAASRPPRLSQGPIVASAPKNCHSPSHLRQTWGPSLGRAPARVPWGLRARGTSGRQTRTQPRHAPAREPPPHRVHPASVRGPSSRPRLKIATVPAGSTRPGAQPSARRPPAARGVPSSRDLEAPVAHQCARTLCHKIRADPRVAPYSMFRHHAGLRKQRPSSPPSFVSSPPIREGRRAVRGGRGGVATHFRTGGEEECARTGDTNPGCNYPVRGYSPSMHFFQGT